MCIRDSFDVVYTCGSHRVLMMLQRVLEDHPAIRGEVAMEQRMACGMGVCLSCVRLFDRDGDRQFLRCAARARCSTSGRS